MLTDGRRTDAGVTGILYSVSTDTVCNNFVRQSYIDKNLTKNKIHVMSSKCEHFQQNIPKIYPFSSSKIHKVVNIKIQISYLKKTV